MTSRYPMIPVPKNVARSAEIGNELRENGFVGATSTGWDRGVQLATQKTISLKDLADMRTWFSRHSPDASGGGTSYPSYMRWVRDGMPNAFHGTHYRGAVSWLLWGGSAAYLWLKQPEIRDMLREYFPKRKEATPENNLDQDDPDRRGTVADKFNQH